LEGVPVIPSGIVTPLAQAQALLAALSPAMAAIRPALMVLDAVLALFKVIQKVPTLVLGDVEGFVSALADAAEKVGKLVGLVPQVSVPIMMNDLVGVMAAFCTGMAAELRAVGSVITQATALRAQAMAAGDAALTAAADCALAQGNAALAHLGASMGPFGSLLDLGSAFLGMIPGGKSLPGAPDLAGSTAEQAAEALEQVGAVLSAMHF
jgi:hypothetical protein